MLDLLLSVAEPFIRDAECQASRETDLESGTQVLQNNSDFGMDEFNKQIQEAEIQVDKLSGILINLKTLLKDANEESKSATNTLEINAIKKRMEKYIDDVVKNVSNVREKLQSLRFEEQLHIDEFFLSPEHTPQADAWMSEGNCFVLTKKLKELLMEFEALRQTIQDEYCEVVERQVNTVTGARPDELSTDHVIEIGSSKQIFPTTFEQRGRGKVISSMEEEIQDRLDAIKEFEKRFLELSQLYLKTSVLVEGHAKILEKIENQVTDAVDRIRRIDENQKVQKLEKISRSYLIYYMLFMGVLVIFNALQNN
ncbi:unnamed protein product [Citrullus colocynthis]|uniref:t-SNARE coiled-coil homology domain-containing protein n=1 Tax=Citrullus colocynthis TaxID=252529 RepID=A0ABP0Y6H9_9ROSI